MASFSAGTPKRITAFTPRSIRSPHLGTERLEVCCTTPGSDSIGCGSLDALTDEERGDEIVDADVHVGDEIAERGGAAEPSGSHARPVGKVAVHPISLRVGPRDHPARRAARRPGSLNRADCQPRSNGGK